MCPPPCPFVVVAAGALVGSRPFPDEGDGGESGGESVIGGGAGDGDGIDDGDSAVAAAGASSSLGTKVESPFGALTRT